MLLIARNEGEISFVWSMADSCNARAVLLVPSAVNCL